MGEGDPIGAAFEAISVAQDLPRGAVESRLSAIGLSEWAAEVFEGRVVDLARHSSAYTPIRVIPSRKAQADAAALEDLPAEEIYPPRRRRSFREWVMLDTEDVLLIHEALVQDFVGTEDPIDPPGVKDPNLLASAVSRQYTSLGGEPKYKTLGHMAAALFYGIALNHAFHNGNKRAAIVALLSLADINDQSISAREADLYTFVLDVVNHRFRPTAAMSTTDAIDAEVEGIAGWITQRLARKQHFQRSLRWRELKVLLRHQGVKITAAGGSKIELVKGKLRTVPDFDGDTREVGPPVLRKIRKDLKLTPRDGCDDDAFYGGTLALDHFLAKYRGLLRDLAHV